MAEPTSKYSFYDLMLRVAKEAAMTYNGSSGNERSMIPATDAHDLELIRDVVNDGIKMFIADSPVKGWRWMRKIAAISITGTRVTGTVDSATDTTLVDATLSTAYAADDDLNLYWCYILTGTGAGSYAQITDYTTLTGTVTVADWLDQYGNAGGTNPAAADTFAITAVETVGGDIARYPLPENFDGEVNGAIEYTADSTHATPIEWVDEALIRVRRAITVISGYPRLAATRPWEYIGGVTGAKRRWELIVDPKPVAAETLTFPYTLHFDKLQLEAGDSSAGDSTSLTDSTLAALYPDDYFNTWIIRIISGTGKNSYAIVTDYTGSSGKFDVADWLSIDGTAAGTDPSGTGGIYYVEPAANLHPAGFSFDEDILAACRAKAEMEIEDVAAGWMQTYHQIALPRAHRKDARTAPRKLGSMDPKRRYGRERTWLDITTDWDI